jgi:hypothetical protein
VTSAIVAALLAALVLGFVEAMGRFYPSKRTWLRLRSRNGRRAVRAMRLRLEAAAANRTPRRLAEVLLVLVVLWIAVSGLLDKFWYEVAADVAPYLFVSLALLRLPAVLRSCAERMKVYERDAGEDPERGLDEPGGPAAIAL